MSDVKIASSGAWRSTAAAKHEPGDGADKFENPVVLFPNEWTMRYFQEKNPELKLHALPLEQTR